MNGSRTFAVILIIMALIGLAVFAAYRYNDRGSIRGVSYGTEMRHGANDLGDDVKDKAKDARDSIDGKTAGDRVKDWGRDSKDAVRDTADRLNHATH